MALTSIEQAVSAINGAQRILIAPSADLSGDTIGGVFALARALERSKKEVCVVLPDELPIRFDFLPKPSQVLREMSFEREFVLSVDTRTVPVKELRYEQDDVALKLFMVAPSHFSLDHVSLERGAHRHDLSITVGAQDLENLGITFERSPQSFYEVPLMNIDRQAGNERYGSVNMVDLTASTVSEVIHSLLEHWNAASISDDIATCLLAGIIDGTRSFQDVSVSPRTLTIAAKLIGAGANRAEIVRTLYKSRPVNHLRLWGRILGMLEVKDKEGLAYAVLTKSHLDDLGVTGKELPAILEDLHMNFPSFVSVVIFFMHENGDAQPTVRGLVSSREEGMLERVVAKFSAKRRLQTVSFRVGTNVLEDAPRVFLDAILKRTEALPPSQTALPPIAAFTESEAVSPLFTADIPHH